MTPTKKKYIAIASIFVIIFVLVFKQRNTIAQAQQFNNLCGNCNGCLNLLWTPGEGCTDIDKSTCLHLQKENPNIHRWCGN